MGSSRHGLARCKNLFVQLKTLFDLRHLGLGFTWAWVYCSYASLTLAPSRADGTSAHFVWLISASTVVISLVASGFALRPGVVTRHRHIALAAPLMLAAGTLLLLVGDLASAAGVVVCLASGVLIGIGFSWMCILWGYSYTRLDADRAELTIPAAAAVTMACTLVFPLLSGVAGAIATALLPLLSGACLWRSYRRAPRESGGAGAGEAGVSEAGGTGAGVEAGRAGAGAPAEELALGRGQLASLAYVFVLLAVSYFAISCLDVVTQAVHAPAGGHGQLDIPVFLGSAAGIVLAVATVFFAIRIDIRSLYRLVTPLLVVGIALFPWDASATSSASVAILSSADTCIQAVAYIFFIGLAQRGLFPVAPGIGLAQASIQLGTLVGNIAGNALVAGYPLAAQSMPACGLALAVICLVVVATIVIPRTDRLADASRTGGRDTTGPMAAGAAASEPAQPDGVAVLAQRFGISAREQDVLELLLQGRSQPYIRERLLLSKSTVATHVRHIYQKMGIHSRQELLDLYEEL